MSLSKIGNLVNTIKIGGNVADALKEFGNIDDAAKALQKYTKIDIATDGAKLLSEAFKVTSKEAAETVKSITNVTTAASAAGNVVTGMGSKISSVFTGLASTLGVSAKALGAGLGVAFVTGLIATVVSAIKKHQDQLVIDVHDAYQVYNTKIAAVK